MKLSTFKNRTKKAFSGRKGKEIALMLLQGESNSWEKGKVRTCFSSGRGRFCKNLDYTEETLRVLHFAGLKQGIDFESSNDAPRGGLCGNYIKLTSKGRKKMIK